MSVVEAPLHAITAFSGVSTAIIAQATSSSDSFLAPAGGAVVAAGLILQAARTYREARNIDVESAREKANQHKARADAAEAERDDSVGRLEQRIRGLEDQIDSLRREHDKAQDENRRRWEGELSGLRDELTLERRRVYARDLLLAEHGVKPPEDPKT